MEVESPVHVHVKKDTPGLVYNLWGVCILTAFVLLWSIAHFNKIFAVNKKGM